MGRSDDAQKALDEALALARELKDQAHVASTLEAQGDNQFYRGDMKAALALYTQARQEAIRTGDEHLILVAEVNLARVNVKVGKYPLAITALRQLSEQADTMGLKYLSVECSVYLAEALLGEKDFKKAQPELQKNRSPTPSPNAATWHPSLTSPPADGCLPFQQALAVRRCRRGLILGVT